MRVSRMGCRHVLRALTALALVVAPLHLSIDGPVVAKAYAGKGGGGNGGGGNGNGGSGGNGGGNGGNSGGNGGGNNGNGGSNGNSGGNSSGNSNSGGNSGNSGGVGSSASSANTANANATEVDDHVNALTGDKVEVSGNSITVTHPNGMKEQIEDGRFRMEDKFGRTIVERKATIADLNRLESL
ncbi:Glycine-rich cell wall protein [Mesorhizobium sp. ORS 3324]|nr:Glycine-rich cell wall protein [Mesorhizobium sp. ORS 3324]